MAFTRLHRRNFLAIFDGVFIAKLAVDPASLADGVGETRTVTITGAAVGDFVMFAPAIDIAGISITGYVSAANTVSFRIQNESAGTLDIATSNWNILVLRPSKLFV